MSNTNGKQRSHQPQQSRGSSSHASASQQVPPSQFLNGGDTDDEEMDLAPASGPVPVFTQAAAGVGSLASSTLPSSRGSVDKLHEGLQKDLILKISSCSTMGELLKLVPVPAQPLTRGILDDVFSASQKLGTVKATKRFWEDQLRSNTIDAFGKVAQLNSIKVPNLQICKEALIPGQDHGLSGMNLDNAIFEAKKAALSQMITIKNREMHNLLEFLQAEAITRRMTDAWRTAYNQNANILTAEHCKVLDDPAILLRVSQVAVTIGESSSERTRLAKEKRQPVKKPKQKVIDAMDVDGKVNQKQLMTLVDEALKRKEQSRKDRALSGKGKRRKEITSNKKKTPKKGKNVPPKSGKVTKNKGRKKAPAERQKRRSV